MYRASLFTAQVLTRELIDTGREERSDPDPPAQPCHRGDPTDTIADTDKTSILRGSPADIISDAANTGRTSAESCPPYYWSFGSINRARSMRSRSMS